VTELVILDGARDRAEEMSGYLPVQSAKPKIAINPKHPERICWGCDKYCAADDLRCGNGTIRTQHPVELFGEDWIDWQLGDSASTPKECEDQQ